MSLRKGIKLICVLLLFTIIFTGCSNNRHLKDLAIVEGIGIDKEQDKISLNLQTLNVGISNSSETPQGNMTINTKKNGESLNSAIVNMSKSLSKRIFFGQNKIIILGKGAAENGLKEHIDYLLRSTDSRADIAVCMAKDKAEDIIKSKENDTAVPCENLLYLINNNEKSGLSILVMAIDLLNLYDDKTSDLYLPVLSKGEDDESVSTANIALFNDNKLSYITTLQETIGFVIMNGKINELIVEVEDKELGRVGVKLSEIKCTKHADIKNNNVLFSVSVTGDMLINEIENGMDAPLDEAAHERIKHLVDAEICRLVSNSFLACKRAKSDAIRLGEQLACDNPQAYEVMSKDWKNAFSKSGIAPSADIRVKKISDNTQVQ